MGSGACKPANDFSSSCIISEYENPFEKNFSQKENMCLYETYQRLENPKEIVGKIFVAIISKVAPELRKEFGIDNQKDNVETWLKKPRVSRHAAQITDFIDQMTTMMGFTHNFMGAWLMVRKTGRLHAKIPFLEKNHNELQTNYFMIFTVVFIQEFIPYLTGKMSLAKNKSSDNNNNWNRKNYSKSTITNVWTHFFNLVEAQLLESFEIEHARCLNMDNRKIFAPHQHIEEKEEKRRRYLAKSESQPEFTDLTRPQEELYEDPF